MKTSSHDPVGLAKRSYAWGSWNSVISILEPLIPLYRSDATLFRMLGGAWFRLGDLFGASIYLERAFKLAPEDRDIALACAALLAARGRDPEAVTIYLELLEAKPDDRFAVKSIEWLRHRDDTAQSSLADPLRGDTAIPALWPEGRLPHWPRVIMLSILIMASLAAITALVLLAAS